MKLNTVAAAVAAFGVCGIASAQSEQKIPSNLSLRVGVALPIEKSLSDVAKTFLSLGAEYTLDSSLFGSGDTYIAVDYWARNFVGSSDRVLPVTLNQRFYGPYRAGGRRTFTFVGLGLAFVDFGQSESAVCFRGGFGVELGENTFTEFAATVGDRAGNVRPNALTFSIGYRF